VRAALFAMMLFTTAPAWCGEDILQVLERSQRQQLAQMTVMDEASPEARVVQGSLDRLLARVTLPVPVSLQVVRGPQVAECLLGRVIVVNVSVAEMNEGERLFVLAHELGHVAQGHWAAMGKLFQKHIPDEVVQEKTDAVARELGREASHLAHEQEYAADAFAWRLLAQLGEPGEAAFDVFRHMPMVNDTATHPGTRKRVAHMRKLVE
jgi:predicted Zn-dependent protease